jgi:multiple sugar transport system ATP-binding protein
VAHLEVRDVRKVYSTGHVALERLSLDIGDGELLVVVGPSGCGKTTLLRLVAGLEELTEGEILLDDVVINDVDERDRDIAMVFQTYALYPHLNVFDNIAFPLKLARVPKDERVARVRAVASTLQLEHVLTKRPAQLSGGQRQRVAMGRAIVRRPSLFLMDEPLSNLDAKLRVQMRSEILTLQRSLETSTLYVTHDQFEAMTLGDRVAVLREGELQQLGGAREIYDRPKNLFVAAFFGSPPMNLIEAEAYEENGRVTLRVGSRVLSLDARESQEQPSIRSYIGRRLVVGFRPEALSIDAAAPGNRKLSAEVKLIEVVGSDLFGHFIIAEARPLSGRTWARAHDIDDPAELEDLAGPTAGTTAIGRFPPDTPLAVGEHVELTITAGSLTFFDPESGTALYRPTSEV